MSSEDREIVLLCCLTPPVGWALLIAAMIGGYRPWHNRTTDAVAAQETAVREVEIPVDIPTT